MHELSAPLASVIDQVAGFEEVPPEDLPPLSDSISSETFTRLTTEWVNQTDPIEFTYIWYRVIISPNGEVTIQP